MKKIIFIMLMAGLLAGSIGAVVMEQDAYNSAIELYNSQKFDEARKGFDSFLNTFPDSKYKAAAMLKLADLTEDKDTAVANYSTIINKYAGTEYEAEASYSLGRLYFIQEDFPQAIENFQRVIDKFKDSMWIEQAYYYNMLSLNAMKNYADAGLLYKEFSIDKKLKTYTNRVLLAYADSLAGKNDDAAAAKAYVEVLTNYTQKEETIYIPSVYKKAITVFLKVPDKAEADKYTAELKEKYPESAEAKGYVLETVPTVTTTLEKPVVVSKTTDAPATVTEAVKNTEAKWFRVQIGAYSHEKWAKEAVKKFEKKGVKAILITEGNMLKVLVGEFETKLQAEKYAKEIENKEGIKKVMIKQY